MKIIKLLFALSCVLFLGFFGCERDNFNSKRISETYVNRLSYENIDALSNEMSRFHYDYMTLFLNNTYLDMTEVNSLSFERILDSINNNLLSYSFNEVTITKQISDYARLNVTIDLYNKIKSYCINDFDFTILNNDNIFNKHLRSINTKDLSNFFLLIDNNICKIVEISSSYNDFIIQYDRFVYKSLKEFKAKNMKEEYFFAKIYADMYLSSLNYLSMYLYCNEKGPRWEKFKGMLKEAWKVTRPIVACDAGGAVVGAMAGVETGPGIVVTGMVGACASSAGKCVEEIVNNIGKTN